MNAWRHAIRFLFAADKVQLLLLLCLVAAGCLFIYGTGQQAGGNLERYWQRQLVFAAAGFAAYLVVSCVNYRFWCRWAWAFYSGSLLLLGAVLVWGQTINHSRSWLPVLGGTLQPAELAKPATVLLLAAVGAAASLGRTPRLKMVFMLLLGVIPLLLIGLQPDWGTAMVFVPVLLAMAFVAGLPWRWLLFGLLAALLAMPLVYKYKLKPYQQERLVTFLKPGDDTSRAGYNAHQSLLAVGSGGFWGKGFMRGNQHVLGFLPRTVAPTDFIFTVVAEETGFVGAAAMVLAFLGIITCCLWTGFNAADELGRLIAVGVATLFLVHVFVNVGMTVQVCPIVGIPLPFVSYGGSFMVSVMLAAGLVQSVHVHRQENRH